MPQQLARITFTILNGQSLSAAVVLHGARVTTIEMPAAWDAANLSFQGSNDNSVFRDVFKEDGTEFVISAAAGRRIHVDSNEVSEHAYLKVRSGTTGTAVNQTADRTLYFEVWT